MNVKDIRYWGRGYIWDCLKRGKEKRKDVIIVFKKNENMIFFENYCKNN